MRSAWEIEQESSGFANVCRRYLGEGADKGRYDIEIWASSKAVAKKAAASN